MALSSRAEKNLAGTGNHCTADFRFLNRLCRLKCRGSIYLHIVLIMKNPKSNPTKTMLTICTGFLVIFIITKIQWMLLVALIIGLIGVLSSFLSNLIDFLWNKLAWVLSLIVPKILLSVIFYFILFPIALLSKLFRKTAVLSLENKVDSVFVNSNKEFNKSSFENPW